MKSEIQVPAGIRGAILSDVERRINDGRAIPGFVVESLARMHPAEIADDLGSEVVLFDDVDQEDFRNSVADVARQYVNYRVAPSIVPFKEPYDLYRKTKVHPLMLGEMGLADTVINLAAQRIGLEHQAVTTGRIVSEELFSGKSDDLSVKDSIRAMLEYQAQTIPDQVIDSSLIVDTTSYIPGFNSVTDENINDPEIIVCIPVANGEEHETLPRTLRLLAEQSIDPELFEVVLLHNSRMSSEEYEEADNENSQVVEDFINRLNKEQAWLEKMYDGITREYPKLKVRAEFAAHGPYATVGYCRARLGQSVAVRHLLRGSKDNPLLLSMDADVATLNRDYLQGMVDTGKSTNSPVITSRVYWRSPERIDKGSMVSKLLKFDRFIQAVGVKLIGLPPYMDTGTAFRLKEYCLAGGHHWLDQFSENINVANLLHKIRKSNDQDPAIVMSNGSIMGSDPRRQIDVMSRGHAPSKSWKPEVTTFGDEDDSVRIQSAPVLLAEKMAEENLESWVWDMISHSVGPPDSRRVEQKRQVIQRGLHMIGLPITV